MKKMPSREKINSLLDIDLDLGITTWKIANGVNPRVAGKRAGSRVKRSFDYGDPKYYRVVAMLGRPYYEHRLIAYMAGNEVDGMEVDHINGDSEDNRIDNLRVVSKKDNCRNIKKASNNTSGVPGVYWDKASGQWRPSISINGKNKHLGRYSDFNEAVKARKAAEIEFGYHPSHGLDRICVQR